MMSSHLEVFVFFFPLCSLVQNPGTKVYIFKHLPYHHPSWREKEINCPSREHERKEFSTIAEMSSFNRGGKVTRHKMFTVYRKSLLTFGQIHLYAYRYPVVLASLKNYLSSVGLPLHFWCKWIDLNVRFRAGFSHSSIDLHICMYTSTTKF